MGRLKTVGVILAAVALVGASARAESSSSRPKPTNLAQALSGTWKGATKVEAGKLVSSRKHANKSGLERDCNLVFDDKAAVKSGSAMGFPLTEGKLSKFDPRTRQVTIDTYYRLGGKKWSVQFKGVFNADFSEIKGQFSNVMGRGSFTLKWSGA